MWVGSSAVMVGMGAAMLLGAGSASADTAGDPGSANPAPASAAPQSASPASTARPSASPVADRLSRGSDARRVAAKVASTISDVRDVPAAASARAASAAASVVSAASALTKPAASALTKPAASALTKPAAAAAVAPGFPLNRFNRAERVRPKPPTLVPAPVTPVPVVPSADPVDPAQFAGTYYEQGSVKQFFSIGLVNTQATYSLNPDGTIKVQNSGNYFFNRGPRSSITGSAVPVNADNTALNVGFGGTPSANPPGNYTILAYAPDYSWVIVSDPSGGSGYILTRDKKISPEQYQELLTRARALGVRGNITPTIQFS
jgi:lipocalin